MYHSVCVCVFVCVCVCVWCGVVWCGVVWCGAVVCVCVCVWCGVVWCGVVWCGVVCVCVCVCWCVCVCMSVGGGGGGGAGCVRVFVSGAFVLCGGWVCIVCRVGEWGVCTRECMYCTELCLGTTRRESSKPKDRMQMSITHKGMRVQRHSGVPLNRKE